MKLPNGYGSVYKLSGNRRRPWVARKTVDWIVHEDKGKAYPKYVFIGYYSSRREALAALADYNKDPYDVHASSITFSEVYERWSDERFPQVSDSNVKGYRASYNACPSLHEMKMSDIKLGHLQHAVDDSGKNAPTLKKMKILFSQMWDWCVRNEVLTKDRKDMISYVNIRKAGNPNRLDRSPFSQDEISLMWERLPEMERIAIPLFLVYTGLRIGELYALKKADVHLEERWFQVTHAKTAAGVREVPIAEKVVPILQRWLSSPSEWVLPNKDGKKMGDRAFRDSWWAPLMEELGFSHLPHDTRHTCVSLLVQAGVDDRIVKKIVGHKGFGVTEAVYTHLDLPTKLEAINRI